GRGPRGDDRLLDAGDLPGGVALVRVDDVERPPVPRAEVDAAQAVLVEARDHEPPAGRAQLRREVEPALRTGRLDDDVAGAAGGQLGDRGDGRRVVPFELERLGGTEPRRALEPGRAP